MSDNVEQLEFAISQRVADLHLPVSWSYLHLNTETVTDVAGDETVPLGDHASLLQLVALYRASDAGIIDLNRPYSLQPRHRTDGRRGVISCMSDGLRLPLRDFLTQTVISADAAAYAVVREAITAQGVSLCNIVADFLDALGLPPLNNRVTYRRSEVSDLCGYGTSMNEQVHILRSLLATTETNAFPVLTDPSRKQCLRTMSSVLKEGGLSRGLPGYGPFKTRVAHASRMPASSHPGVRSDGAIYFRAGEPQFIVSICVYDIPDWIGALPGLVRVEDFMRDVSRLCWNASPTAQHATQKV